MSLISSSVSFLVVLLGEMTLVLSTGIAFKSQGRDVVDYRSGDLLLLTHVKSSFDRPVLIFCISSHVLAWFIFTQKLGFITNLSPKSYKKVAVLSRRTENKDSNDETRQTLKKQKQKQKNRRPQDKKRKTTPICASSVDSSQSLSPLPGGNKGSGTTPHSRHVAPF